MKTKKGVIEHQRCQLCVKYYNYITPYFLHYEYMLHKAWYDYSDEVHQKLNLPVLEINSETKQFKVNLHECIPRLIRETEAMCKLGLGKYFCIIFEFDKLDYNCFINIAVPAQAQLLTYCRSKVENAYERLQNIVNRHNKIRSSVDSVFINFMRPRLKKMCIAFKPGFSIITWTSQNLTNYFDNLDTTLQDFENFLKKISDILKRRVEDNIEYISNSILVHLPPDVVPIEELIDLNNAHRRVVEKKLAMKSFAIEMAVIDLINMFVDEAVVSSYDANGKYRYQLPQDQINESNWRVEEMKPLDKYDWIQFEQILRSVFYPLEDERLSILFQDYEDVYYEWTQLRNDAMNFYSFFHNALIAALVDATKKSLDLLRKRANVTK